MGRCSLAQVGYMWKRADGKSLMPIWERVKPDWFVHEHAPVRDEHLHQTRFAGDLQPGDAWI